MKKEIRDRERKLFKESMELRNLNLSKTNWKQAQEIRKKQDTAWKKHQFLKNLIKAVEENEGSEK